MTYQQDPIKYQKRIEQSVAGKKAQRTIKARLLCDAGAAKIIKFMERK